MIGSVARVPASVLSGRLTQDTVKLEFRNPNHEIADYIYWLLRTPQYRDYCEGHATGSAVVALSRDDFLSYPVPPFTVTRRRIVETLGRVESKIELNRRMNATLEAIARAFFKSWFVDFDPVRAKLDGREPTGLNPETSGLFPEQLEESRLGHLPKGWRVCTLSEIANNVSVTFDFRRAPEVVFINTGDVLEGDFLHSKRSPHASLPGQAKKSIRPDDILFSEIRPANKRYAYVDFDSSDYVVSTKFMIIRGSKEVHPRFLYRVITAKEALDEFQVQAESRSGTFPQVTFDSISHMTIVVPPIEVQVAFQQAVGKLDAQIKVNKQQTHTLAALREALLPKLFSGEIPMSEASEMAEAAL
jgi:type I restriction enzyme S subunit